MTQPNCERQVTGEPEERSEWKHFAFRLLSFVQTYCHISKFTFPVCLQFATSCSHHCCWQIWPTPAPSFLRPPKWTAVEMLSRIPWAFSIRPVEWTVTVFSVSLSQRQLLLTSTNGFMKTNLITPFTIAIQWFLFLQRAPTNAFTHTSAWWNINCKLCRLDEVCKRLRCK